MYTTIRKKIYDNLKIMDLGTRYGEREITDNRSADNMELVFDIKWSTGMERQNILVLITNFSDRLYIDFQKFITSY